MSSKQNTGQLIAAYSRDNFSALRYLEVAQDIYDKNKDQLKADEEPVRELQLAIENLGVHQVRYKEGTSINPTAFNDLLSKFQKITREEPRDNTGRYRNKDLRCVAFICIAQLYALKYPWEGGIIKKYMDDAERENHKFFKAILEEEKIHLPRPRLRLDLEYILYLRL